MLEANKYNEELEEIKRYFRDNKQLYTAEDCKKICFALNQAFRLGVKQSVRELEFSERFTPYKLSEIKEVLRLC